MNIVDFERVIDAPVDVVWSLINSADGLNQWMSVEATVDLTVGGVIRWVHDNGWVVSGEFREIVPMRRLVFTYGWEQGGFPVPLGSSIVTLAMEALGASTRLSVRHDQLTAEMATQHQQGWTMFIERLVLCAEGADT